VLFTRGVPRSGFRPAELGGTMTGETAPGRMPFQPGLVGTNGFGGGAAGAERGGRGVGAVGRAEGSDGFQARACPESC